MAAIDGARSSPPRLQGFARAVIFAVRPSPSLQSAAASSPGVVVVVPRRCPWPPGIGALGREAASFGRRANEVKDVRAFMALLRALSPGFAALSEKRTRLRLRETTLAFVVILCWCYGNA